MWKWIDVIWMSIVSVVLIVISVALRHDVHAEEPKAEPTPAATVKEPLTVDEIQFIRDQFRNAVAGTAINLAMKPRYAKFDNALVEVEYPDNAINEMLQKKVFKDKEDMEKQIYEGVYKTEGGRRPASTQAEASFIGRKIGEKMLADPKFFDEMLAVVKKMVEDSNKKTEKPKS